MLNEMQFQIFQNLYITMCHRVDELNNEERILFQQIIRTINENARYVESILKLNNEKFEEDNYGAYRNSKQNPPRDS